jgi:polysaccharide biosynthesis protein PslH
VVQQVQKVVVLTESDRVAFETMTPGTSIARIPLGTEIPEHALNPVGSESSTLLFFGSFTHPPNLDAALRLTRHIFPAIKSQYPGAKLYIVGDRPPPELRQTANAAIIVTGRVPDLSPYLERASLVVVPLRAGGGMRVKVLEALAAGKAVIASRLAAAGLDLVDGEQVCFAESDWEIGQRVIELLGNAEQRERLAKTARSWACQHASWGRPVEAYEEGYRGLLEGRSKWNMTEGRCLAERHN